MCSAVAEPPADAAATIVIGPKRRRRRKPAIPAAMRKEIARYARAIGKKYRTFFDRDHRLKQRIGRLTAALLPPRTRRPGRPYDPEISHVLKLYSRFRRQHPEARSAELWIMVAGKLYPEYSSLPTMVQQDICHGLRERARSRMRKRPRNLSRQK